MKASKVQTLRGLACLCLVAYHVVGATNLQGMHIASGWLRDLMDALAVVRMPLFGLIAGAMYGYSQKYGWELVRYKSQRLLIPMLTVGTGFAITQYLVPGTNLPMKELYLIHIVPVAHYWFLESLFLIFCTVAVVEKLWPIQSTSTWCAVFGLSVLVYLYTPGVVWFSILGATYLMPYFLVGLGMTRLRWDDQQVKRRAGLMLTAAGILALWAVWLFSPEALLDRRSALVLTAGICLSSGLWSLGMRQPLLARIGDYSFAIFLFHVFFTAPTRMALQGAGWDSHATVFMALMVTGIMGPMAIHKALASRPCWNFYWLGSPTPLGTRS